MSFNDRMLTDADFRDRVEGDAVARMNPERSLDGDWADRVANLRAHADAIEAGDKRGAKLLREAATCTSLSLRRTRPCSRTALPSRCRA
jgi:hypothetical protein